MVMAGNHNSGSVRTAGRRQFHVADPVWRQVFMAGSIDDACPAGSKPPFDAVSALRKTQNLLDERDRILDRRTRRVPEYHLCLSIAVHVRRKEHSVGYIRIRILL